MAIVRVTLEARKWAHILQGMGHSCFWMAGELDAPPAVSLHAPLAYFNHPEVAEVQAKLFGVAFHTRAVTNQIQSFKERLKDDLYCFVEKFQLEVLIPENILAIPMHVLLGLAMTETIAETTFPVIAHHHDFAWERERFTLNAVNDYLQAAFPPLLYAMEHVVINSMAQKELARRYGIPSQIIPNILDSETPPPGLDDYNRDLRREISLSDDDWLILQPTRVVQRKGIEHAIELIHRLDHRARLVISHASGDEGHDYELRLRKYAELLNVPTNFVTDIISDQRGLLPDARKVYTLWDTYQCADLVTLQAANSEGGRRMLARGHQLRLGTGVVGYAALRGTPRIALDVGKDAVFFNNPDLPETRSEVALPLKSRAETIGILDVQSREAAAFSSNDLLILTTLANQVAIAIENARLLTDTRAALVQVQAVYDEFTRAEWSRTVARLEQPGYRYNAGRIEMLEKGLKAPEVLEAIQNGEVSSGATNGSDASGPRTTGKGPRATWATSSSSSWAG